MPRNKMTKRTDGYYKVSYKGKQFYAKTQAEALAKRDAYIRDEQAGLDVLNYERSIFRNYAMHWIDVYRADCGKTQHRQYITMADYCAERLPKMMKDITVQDIQKVVNSLSCYSPSHVNKFMTTIRGIFSTAFAEGVIKHNPMEAIRRPKTKKVEGHRVLEPWERELVRTTCMEHDFGPAAMVMMYAGLRRGEVMYLDIDRDVDFDKKTITVRGAVSFPNGTHAEITTGKTAAAQRSIPLVKPLEKVLEGRHGLLLTKEDGEMMTLTAFERKLQSYINFLEVKVNGCPKRWYGKTKEHKALQAKGKEMPEWRDVTIRCHDFRVDFCTRNYEAGIPIKTLQKWMGHADAQMIMNIYAKLTEAQEQADALKLMGFMDDTSDENGKRKSRQPRKK